MQATVISVIVPLSCDIEGSLFFSFLFGGQCVVVFVFVQLWLISSFGSRMLCGKSVERQGNLMANHGIGQCRIKVEVNGCAFIIQKWTQWASDDEDHVLRKALAYTCQVRRPWPLGVSSRVSGHFHALCLDVRVDCHSLLRTGVQTSSKRYPPTYPPRQL